MPFGLRPLVGQLYSTQYGVRRSLSQTMGRATVQMAVGRPKWADPNGVGARGTGCEAPTVQMAMIRAGYPMVGRSFGRDLAEACTVRKSLYSTQEFVPNDLGLYRWACAVGCVQWVDPTDQLAQFGTKRAKRGPGVRGLWPNSVGPQSPLSQVGRLLRNAT